MQPPYDEKQVYLRARELPPEAREEYLRIACPSEDDRRIIRKLLESDETDRLVIGMGTAATADQLMPELETQVGRLRLIRQIDEGGMGVVFLAEHTELRKPFAVKFLKSNLIHSERAVAQFIEEAKKAAKLNHPGIVQVLDLHREGDRTYIVSEYVDGPTLGEWAKRESPILASNAATQARRDWVTRATQIVATIADALDCAHRNGIVHCDVKPSNILMDPLRGPRLSDFGIARYLAPSDQPNYTATQLTPWYASPEQAAAIATPIDERSDIFSLGIVLYELLTGTRPFDGANMHAILDAVRHYHPPMVRGINRVVPRDLETVCHKALEKSPVHRYPTAAHMAADLRSWLAGEPILARPPGLGRRAVHWLRKHRMAAAVCTLSGICLLGAWGVYSWRQQWKSQQAAVMITGAPTDAELLVQRIAPETFELGTVKRLPLENGKPIYLVPGVYRCTVVERTTSKFAEFDVALGAGPVTFEIHFVIPTTEAMSTVPAGEYQVGTDGATGILAVRRVRLAAFLLDLHEVTNQEYKNFIDRTQAEAPRQWVGRGFPAGLGDRPVVGISMEEASAYARWAGKRLPTALEWEAAARLPDGRPYPWGIDGTQGGAAVDTDSEAVRRASTNDPFLLFENYKEFSSSALSGPASLNCGAFFNMFGNVREYTSSVDAKAGNAAVVKGRCWLDPVPATTLANAWLQPAGKHSFRTGFRCARSVAVPE